MESETSVARNLIHANDQPREFAAREPLQMLHMRGNAASTIAAVAQDCFLRVRSGGRGSREYAVSVRAKSSLMNDRIGDMRCVATSYVPHLRTDAALAIVALALVRFVPRNRH